MFLESQLNWVRTPVGLGKAGIVILGIFVLAIGVHSHNKSDWTEEYTWFGVVDGTPRIETYKFCKSEYWDQIKLKYKNLSKCPSIHMERYFVVINIIFFVLSIINFVGSALMGERFKSFKVIDMGYHLVAALLILISAIVYIVSANQIKGLQDALNLKSIDNGEPMKFLHAEKITAGVFTIFLTAAYLVVPFFIWKS